MHGCIHFPTLQVKRATKFLNILFKHAPEPVIVVITHSGFARSILLAVQREPYRPQNAELLPVLVEKTRKHGDSLGDEDDSWINDVVETHDGQQQEKQEAQSAWRGQQQQSPCIVRRFIAWAMQKLAERRQ